jgi:uncharacterized OB-fold protein
LSQPTSSQSEFTIRSFFRRLENEGRLSGAVCRECRFRMVPPRPACSRCLSSNLELFEPGKEGKLVGFSEVHVANDAFQGSVPYIVGIADLDGVKIPGIIRGADVRKLKIGSQVHVNVRPPSAAPETQGSPAYWFSLA